MANRDKESPVLAYGEVPVNREGTKVVFYKVREKQFTNEKGENRKFQTFELFYPRHYTDTSGEDKVFFETELALSFLGPCVDALRKIDAEFNEGKVFGGGSPKKTKVPF